MITACQRLKIFIFFLLFWKIFCKDIGGDDSWLKIAKNMKNYVDISINPCSDFYEYACGKWSYVNSQIDFGDVLGLMELKINQQISFMLSRTVLKERDKSSALSKAAIFYKSCVENRNRSNQFFLENLEPFKEWTSQMDINKFDWIDLTAKLRLYGINIFIEESVLPHWNDSRKNCIYVDRANLPSLPKRFYHDQSLEYFLSTYKATVSEIFESLGYRDIEARKIADDLILFEKKLVSIMSNESEYSDTAEEMVVGYLNYALPQIDWIKYFSIIFNKNVELNETVVVLSPSYFQRLSDLIQNTSNEILINYFKFSILAFLDDFKDFNENDCLNVVRNRIGKALSAPYVEQYQKKNNADGALKMIEELKASLLNILNKSTWLDKYTQFAAKSKLNSTLFGVSIKDVEKYYDFIDEFYQNLDVDKNNFHKNYWTIINYEVRKEHDKLLKRNNRAEHSKFQAVANAYYLKTQNYVVIPAGLLQEPIFDQKYPEAYNYGVLGTIIGHEISHGLDYTGIDYDAEGNIRTWWHDEMIKEYEIRTECMIKQYNNYMKDNIQHPTNGEIAISENIADNMGLRLAYEAFSKLNESINADEMLDTSNRKLFFLSYAQFFCSKLDNSILKEMPIEHSLDKLRVNGALANMIEFSEVYNCPFGSEMNPLEKCQLF